MWSNACFLPFSCSVSFTPTFAVFWRLWLSVTHVLSTQLYGDSIGEDLNERSPVDQCDIFVPQIGNVFPNDMDVHEQ